MPDYDNFKHGSLAAQVSSSGVSEVQQLLKLLGYDPGDVNGFWDTGTRNALQALWMVLGKQTPIPEGPTPELLAELRQLVARNQTAPASEALAPPPSLVDLAPAPTGFQRPAWLTGNVMALGLGAAALVYFYWQKDKPAEASPEAAAPLAGKRKRAAAPAEEKCGRSPTLEFEAGTPVALSPSLQTVDAVPAVVEAA